MNQKINTLKEIVYVAKNFTPSLSDLIVSVRKPDGTIFTPAPTIIEQGDGIYKTSYTPNALGVWQEKISSVSNGDLIIRSCVVVSYDLSDIQSQNVVIDSKIDTVDGKVDDLQNTANSIETKIDNLDVEIAPGGYFA